MKLPILISIALIAAFCSAATPLEQRIASRHTILTSDTWGGFFSIRYTNAYPDRVARIYLDAPLLTFDKFAPADAPTQAARAIGPWVKTPPADGKWSDDPRMPVNMAASIAAARIPVYLLIPTASISKSARKSSTSSRLN